jgi:hypothetical protein
VAEKIGDNGDLEYVMSTSNHTIVVDVVQLGESFTISIPGQYIDGIRRDFPAGTDVDWQGFISAALDHYFSKVGIKDRAIA